MTKTHLLCLLFAAVFCCSCEGRKKDVQTYLDETARLYRQHAGDAAAAAKVLSEGLTVHPDSLPLLQARAGLYCRRGMLPECRADTRRMLALKPDLAEARMGLCMLDEVEGRDGKRDTACYLEAAGIFAARLATASPKNKNANKANYIFALLMAGAPQAEAEKKAFLATMPPGPDATAYQDIFANFDRKRFLREAFSQ